MMQASIEIDAGRVKHRIPRTIYGHFIEHLGRCIDEGLWTEKGDPAQLFLGGIRREVLEAVRAIRPALIRYPGGCFADTYHWEDGVGPREKRPVRPNRAWGKLGLEFGPRDHNHFGTDEFLRLCEEVGAEPMLTVNVGSGTPEEAAAWVEYVNGPADSVHGRRRADNGRIEPYRVRLWCIGNELWGPHETGWSGPWRYAQKVLAFSRAMREIDPQIELISCGLPTPLGTWNKVVLKNTGPHTDYLSIHYYYPPILPHTRMIRRDKGRRPEDYYWVLGGANAVNMYLAWAANSVKKHSPPGKRVLIAYDEWNLWFGHRDIVMAKYNLRDGLFVASVLNILQRRADFVPIACLAQMINCLGLITADERGVFLTPSAWVFKMYAENAGDLHLPTRCQSEKVTWRDNIRRRHRMRALDAAATLDESRQTLTIFVVNRHFDQPISAQIALQGFPADNHLTVHELFHDDPFRYNTFEDPQAVVIKTRESKASLHVDGSGVRFTQEFPPHSVSALVLERKEGL